MNHPYGPWATLITAGRSPQLSAFWRRRLTMLVPVSRTSPALAMRHRLGLGVAGLLILVLPTIRAAPAVAEPAGKTPTTVSGTINSDHSPDATRRAADAASRESEDLTHFIPWCAFNAIQFDSFGAKELGLSNQQQTELRTVFDAFGTELARINRKQGKELEKVPPKERPAKLAEIDATATQLVKDYRKRAEALLTGKQMTKLKHIVLRKSVAMLLVPQEREKIGLTDEQAKQLLRLGDERDARAREQVTRTPRILRELAAQSLAVLNPQQRQKLMLYVDGQPALVDTIVSTFPPPNVNVGRAGGGPSDAPPMILGHSRELRKELGLSAGQVARLKTLTVEYLACSAKLQDFFDQIQTLPPKERKTAWAENERKRHEMEKDTRKQIDKVLTPQQLAALQKSILDDAATTALASSWMLKHIDASAEQQRALRRLGDTQEETNRKDAQLFRETDTKFGEDSLKVLTLRQQEVFQEEVERLGR